MEESLQFAPLLLVFALAFFVPLILGRVRWLPVVVGEILAGVIIGRSGLNIVGHTVTLEVFSTIGLAFLMFLAGMEIDFSRLFPKRRGGESQPNGPNPLMLAVVSYLATLLLAVPAGFLLNRMGLNANPWLMAFVLSATSLGVLLPVLKQRAMTHTPAGQLIFYTAILADFVTVLLLTIFVITLSRGLSFEVLSIGLLFLAFFLVYRLGERFFRVRQIRSLVDELSHVTVQIKVRGAVALLMAFVALAVALGVELILGAFLAGMVVSLLMTDDDEDAVEKLEAFGFGFFIPVFFIQVGIDLDLRALLNSPASLLLLPVLLAVSLIVKGLPTLVFRRMISWRETLGAAALLNTHLSLEIAVAVIGARLGLLSEAANTTVILFAVVTVLTMPILFNSFMPAVESKKPRWMVITGGEDLSLKVGRILRNSGEQVRFLETDTPPEQARPGSFKDLSTNELLERLAEVSQEGVQTLLALSSSDNRNLMICYTGARYGIENMVALVNNQNRLQDYRDLGVKVYVPILHRPALLSLMARSPDIFQLLTGTEDGQDICEVLLRNPASDGRLLRNMNLPANLLVLAVGRNGDIIIPHGNTRLVVGDRLTLLGKTEDLQEAANWLENGSPA